MASCRLSSEIEGAKNRLSLVQQKNTSLQSNSENDIGKRSLSKGEVNIKERILRNRVEKVKTTRNPDSDCDRSNDQQEYWQG